MPTLRQLSCSIEWGNTGVPFMEYGTRYGDRVVESWIAIPDKPQPFAIHIKSKGFIAEGLAVLVFADGQYHCNRNRTNLKPGKGKSRSQATEVDFIMRQKEKLIGDGRYIGRDWRFDSANIVPNLPSEVDEEHFTCLGSIDVLVLRCAAAKSAEDILSRTSSDADEDVLDAIAAQQAHAGNSVGDESDSDSDDDSSSAGAVPHKGNQDGSMMGGMFGLFDGANDQQGSSQGQKGVHFDYGHPQHGQLPPQQMHGMGPDRRNWHHPYQVPYNPSGLPEPPAVPLPSHAKMVEAEHAHRQPLYPQYQGGHCNYNPPPPLLHVPPVQGGNQSGQSHPPGPGYFAPQHHYNHQYYPIHNTNLPATYCQNQYMPYQMPYTMPGAYPAQFAFPNPDHPNAVDPTGNNNGGSPKSNGNEAEDDKPADKNGQDTDNWNKSGDGSGAGQDNGASNDDSWGNDNNTGQQNDGETAPNWDQNSAQDGAASAPSNMDWTSTAPLQPQNASVTPAAIQPVPIPTNQGDASGQPRSFYGPFGAYYSVEPPTSPDLEVGAEEEPKYDVPQHWADKEAITKQVQCGRGYFYVHKGATPVYIDTVQEPYARFAFMYRTRDQLKDTIDIDLEEEPSGDQEVQQLQGLDKQEIIEMLLRAKSALGGKIPEPPPKGSATAGVAGQARQPVAVPATKYQFLYETGIPNDVNANQGGGGGNNNGNNAGAGAPAAVMSRTQPATNLAPVQQNTNDNNQQGGSTWQHTAPVAASQPNVDWSSGGGGGGQAEPPKGGW